jgi:hypothetical protein
MSDVANPAKRCRSPSASCGLGCSIAWCRTTLRTMKPTIYVSPTRSKLMRFALRSARSFAGMRSFAPLFRSSRRNRPHRFPGKQVAENPLPFRREARKAGCESGVTPGSRHGLPRRALHALTAPLCRPARDRLSVRRSAPEPAFGGRLLVQVARALGSRMHVYGHSHFNRRTMIDGGPSTAGRRLHCVTQRHLRSNTREDRSVHLGRPHRRRSR